MGRILSLSSYVVVPLIRTLLAGFVTVSCLVAQAGSASGGGANGDANAKALLQKLIIDDAYLLKYSMKRYLQNMVMNQVADPMVKGTLTRIGINNLMDDIDRSHYRIEAGVGETYIPEIGQRTGVKMQPAATTDFSQRADVRFDIDLLFEEVKNMSEEEKIKNVASLAFHEHIHHFQTKPKNDQDLMERENEAYAVSGYVLITADFDQIPVMTWRLRVPPYQPQKNYRVADYTVGFHDLGSQCFNADSQGNAFGDPVDDNLCATGKYGVEEVAASYGNGYDCFRLGCLTQTQCANPSDFHAYGNHVAASFCNP